MVCQVATEGSPHPDHVSPQADIMLEWTCTLPHALSEASARMSFNTRAIVYRNNVNCLFYGNFKLCTIWFPIHAWFGCLWSTSLALARDADVVVLAVGTDKSVEGEGHDRPDSNLPGMQDFILNTP